MEHGDDRAARRLLALSKCGELDGECEAPMFAQDVVLGAVEVRVSWLVPRMMQCTGVLVRRTESLEEQALARLSGSRQTVVAVDLRVGYHAIAQDAPPDAIESIVLTEKCIGYEVTVVLKPILTIHPTEREHVTEARWRVTFLARSAPSLTAQTA